MSPPSPSTLLVVSFSSLDPMMRNIRCLVLVKVNKMNVDPGVLMNGISEVLKNLPLEAARDK